MTTQTYPRTFAPEWDFLEANAALGAILTAEKVAEETYLDLRHRGGDTEAVNTHLSMLIRAEMALRHAMSIDDLDDEMRNAGVGR